MNNFVLISMSKIIATIFYVNQTLGLVSKRVVRFPNPLTPGSDIQIHVVCPASGWWCYLTRAGEERSANRICIHCTLVSVFFASRWWCWLVSCRCLWRSHLICRQFCINSDYLCIVSQHNVDCDATVSVCPARGWWRWWKSCRVYWRSLLICK